MHTGGSEEKEEDICRNVQTDVGTDTKPQPIYSKLNRGILFFVDLHSGCAFPLVFHLNGDACEHAEPMYIQWMDPWAYVHSVDGSLADKTDSSNFIKLHYVIPYAPCTVLR